MIVDPPNGLIPAMTPEAQKIVAADRQFRLALLQATETCKSKSVACSGGKYDPTPSPRLAEPPPRYNTARMNRHDGPEDGALADRCLTARTAGIRRPDRQLPPHRANARRHLDFLRRGPGSGLATQHRHERKSTPAEQHPPMVRRLARPLGGQYARGRCDELQCEDRLPRLP